MMISGGKFKEPEKLENKQEKVNKLAYKDWLKEIFPYGNEESYVRYEDKEEKLSNRKRLYIYTHDNVYAITVEWREENNGYLGCVVSCRKPRAGEDWTRGNDLPDGPYSYETWKKIKNAIIKHELVKVSKKRGIMNIEEMICEEAK